MGWKEKLLILNNQPIMKLDQFNIPYLNRELEEKLISRNLPDNIIEEMEGVSNERILSIINDDSYSEEGPVLESIVKAYKRPSFLVQNSVFDPSVSEFWNGLLTPNISTLSDATLSVGRIELKNHNALDWAGTGFLITDNIIVTNRHVANHFVITSDGNYNWKVNGRGKFVKARIDFKEEYMNPEEQEFELKRILYVEPYPGPDVALFEVEMEDPISPLTLNTFAAKDDIIVTIGYPWKDTRVSYRVQEIMERIFSNIYDVKRLAPGMIVSIEDDIIHHDCTTLGGNSGSAILDAESGDVVALHYGGDVMYNNAVSAQAILSCLNKI